MEEINKKEKKIIKFLTQSLKFLKSTNNEEIINEIDTYMRGELHTGVFLKRLSKITNKHNKKLLFIKEKMKTKVSFLDQNLQNNLMHDKKIIAFLSKDKNVFVKNYYLLFKKIYTIADLADRYNEMCINNNCPHTSKLFFELNFFLILIEFINQFLGYLLLYNDNLEQKKDEIEKKLNDNKLTIGDVKTYLLKIKNLKKDIDNSVLFSKSESLLDLRNKIAHYNYYISDDKVIFDRPIDMKFDNAFAIVYILCQYIVLDRRELDIFYSSSSILELTKVKRKVPGNSKELIIRNEIISKLKNILKK